jgi:hypothetical protein
MIAARTTVAERKESLAPAAGGPLPVGDSLRALYTSMRPLRACADQLRCEIGVRVSMPYAQPLHMPPRPVLDVSAELPCVYTEVLLCIGLAPPQWRVTATRQTETVLARLDQLLAELGEHRARLAIQLERLGDESAEIVAFDAGVATPELARPGATGRQANEVAR